jgi:hypothetical protein
MRRIPNANINNYQGVVNLGKIKGDVKVKNLTPPEKEPETNLAALQSQAVSTEVDATGADTSYGPSHLQTAGHALPIVPNIFISYAHADADWLAQLEMHLKPMVRSAKLDTWADTKLQPGSEWEKDILAALSAANAGVLLVTPAFLASDFIFQKELPELLRKKVLWIAVRYCNYQETEIAKYQALNDPARPLASLSSSDLDREWVRICEKVKKALQTP